MLHILLAAIPVRNLPGSCISRTGGRPQRSPSYVCWVPGQLVLVPSLPDSVFIIVQNLPCLFISRTGVGPHHGTAGALTSWNGRHVCIPTEAVPEQDLENKW